MSARFDFQTLVKLLKLLKIKWDEFQDLEPQELVTLHQTDFCVLDFRQSFLKLLAVFASLTHHRTERSAL
jgi:hypothetical protein